MAVDHPRVGGEKSGNLGFPLGIQGSPPRGRGKVVPNPFGGSWLGITPAWAGKRADALILGQIVPDHPRVGGEKALARARFSR